MSAHIRDIRALDGARILIVDDLDSNVVLLQRLLELAGINDIHVLTDSRDAVATCLELDPDLLLLDLHMPFVSGAQVLERLRDVLPSDAFFPILVLTADTSSEAREQALDLGAKDFLTKPFDRVEVVQRVRNLLEMRHLYQGVQAHNAFLQAEVEAQEQERRRAEQELDQLRQRVDAAFVPGALEMAYQPIIDLRTSLPVGVEALARFKGEPVRPPNEWFADAKVVGRGVELEIAAIDAAVAALPRMAPDQILSVNASPACAMSSLLVPSLSGATGSRIILELTEHEIIEDYDALLHALDGIREQGVRIAVDDAGAGYAGFQQILGLRPDIIKLDIDITRGIESDPVRRAMAAALLSFGRDTGATVIAEGIETAGELQVLQQLGVPWGQGYHLGRPGPLRTASNGHAEDVHQQERRAEC